MEKKETTPLLKGKESTRHKWNETPLEDRGDKSSFSTAGIEIPPNPPSLEVEEIVLLLKTNLETGLSWDESSRRLEIIGPNVLEEAKGPSIFKMFFKQITDFMVLILICAGIASLVLRDWIEAATLFLVVIANVLISFFQEFKAEKALQALKKLTVPNAVVVRNSEKKQIPANLVMPGDICLLEEGSQVPADMRLAEEVNLEVLEAILTGESAPVQKEVNPLDEKENVPLGDQHNMAFMSTLVVKGHGKGIVVATGKNTEVGKISKVLTEMSTEAESTLLQKRLQKLGLVLVVLSIVLCAVIVGIGFLRQWKSPEGVTPESVKLWIKVGVSLAVSVIPEGLVAVVSVTMALGVQRMAKRKAIVRKMTAVETLGSITTICADKTGTLTLGKMKLEELRLGDKRYTISGAGYEPKGALYIGDTQVKPDHMSRSLKLAMMICALCNNSTLQKDSETGRWEGIGDPTEVALEVAARKVNMGKQTLINQMKAEMIKEIAFDSVRMRMTVVYSVEENSKKQYYVLSKGAPGSLLSISSKIVWDGEKLLDINQDLIQQMEKRATDMATRGLRVLALAYKEISESDPILSTKEEQSDEDEAKAVEQNLTFLGLIGLFDPPRKEVKSAIEECRRAGIRVIIITGDHPKTAFGIACQIGLLLEDEFYKVKRGSEIEALTVDQLAAMDDFPAVFARVNPQTKLKIVETLKKRGEVVAMMGDGVNDAAAIKSANAGISMGQGATELTKQAADIILTDDNFISIIPALEEGRRTYDNIKKFIMYLLACNSAEIYVMLFCVAVGLPAPFTPVMILWANLICDTPPALALGIDPAETDILQRKPRDPKSGIFNWRTTLMVLAHGFSMAGITAALFVYGIYWMNYDTPTDLDSPGHARGLAFVGLCVVQLIHAFLARSSRNTVFTKEFFSNRWILVGVGFALAAIVLACYIPFLRSILGQWPLTLHDWIAILIGVSIHVVIVEGLKLTFRLVEKYKTPPSVKLKEKFFEDV